MHLAGGHIADYIETSRDPTWHPDHSRMQMGWIPTTTAIVPPGMPGGRQPRSLCVSAQHALKRGKATREEYDE